MKVSTCSQCHFCFPGVYSGAPLVPPAAALCLIGFVLITLLDILGFIFDSGLLHVLHTQALVHFLVP